MPWSLVEGVCGYVVLVDLKLVSMELVDLKVVSVYLEGLGSRER